jgi:succinate dehydrogenase/fumarate reductase flavoprotein subunit
MFVLSLTITTPTVTSNSTFCVLNFSNTLATEAIRGEGGILLNSKAERFMKSYYPEINEMTRPISSRFHFLE